MRVSKTEEGVRLIHDLWTKDLVEFEGKYYRAKGAVLEPKSVQKPHPPLLFGGSSPRMLNLAGSYGDIVFLAPDMKLGFAEAREIVRKAVRNSGRAEKISFTTSYPRDVSEYSREKFRDAILEAEKTIANTLTSPSPSPSSWTR